MKILVACEFSGRVRDAFRQLGHDAWSCDLLDCESNPTYHHKQDVLELLEQQWDLLIAHPPCTYLTVAGNKWFKPEYATRFPDRREKRQEALSFVRTLLGCTIPRIAVENPIGVISTAIRKPDQIIQPFMFGAPERKPTCLWLKNLPNLRPTKQVDPIIKLNRNGKTASYQHDMYLSLPPLERMKARSRTYVGVAQAMAEQWGSLGPLS